MPNDLTQNVVTFATWEYMFLVETIEGFWLQFHTRKSKSSRFKKHGKAALFWSRPHFALSGPFFVRSGTTAATGQFSCAAHKDSPVQLRAEKRLGALVQPLGFF